VFDVYVGSPGSGRYLDDADLDDACTRLRVDRFRCSAVGRTSNEVLLAYTEGRESVSGRGLLVREGVRAAASRAGLRRAAACS
jgi:hypothetical protein